MNRPSSVWLLAILLAISVALYGCTSDSPGTSLTPSPSGTASGLALYLNESGGISGSFFKSWSLSNGTLSVVQQGRTLSKTLSAAEIAALVRYFSDSGFFSKPLSENNRCADCFAYGGFVQLGGQRREVQLGGNDVVSDTLDGLVQRLNQVSPVFSATGTGAVQCQKDSDCVASGCSGTQCLPKSAPSSITTCEYRNEYACYKPGGCLCNAGTCAWSQDTIQCLQDFNKPAGQSAAESACQTLCAQQLSAGAVLSNGPCLSDAVVPNWVCDVAHNPRQDAVDNDPKNTCPAYGSTAKHFVEVDGNCQLIQAA